MCGEPCPVVREDGAATPILPDCSVAHNRWPMIVRLTLCPIVKSRTLARTEAEALRTIEYSFITNAAFLTERPSRLRKNSPRRLEPACSAESFVALRSQRYGVAPSSLLVSTKHSGPIRTRRVFPQPAGCVSPAICFQARCCRVCSPCRDALRVRRRRRWRVKQPKRTDSMSWLRSLLGAPKPNPRFGLTGTTFPWSTTMSTWPSTGALNRGRSR